MEGNIDMSHIMMGIKKVHLVAILCHRVTNNGEEEARRVDVLVVEGVRSESRLVEEKALVLPKQISVSYSVDVKVK